MTVNELINELKKFPPDMLVARELYSEQKLLSGEDFGIVRLCRPRPDGWIQNYRKDMESIEYVLFDGN